MFTKKIIIGMLLVFVLSLSTGVGVGLFINKTDGKAEESDPKSFDYLPTLNHADFKEKYDAGQEFYVYIGRPECGDSIKFNKEFESVFVDFNTDGTVADIKYDLDVKNFYYFNVAEIIPDFKQEDRDQYKDLYGFYFTPSLVHYKDGKVVNIAEWDSIYGFSSADYMKWFYETDLIVPNNEVYHEGATDKE
ncbi:thiol-disulfide isomerase [Haloplasma contractile]|uniref:Bacteriocin transport accessory protein n=1 Tax=Haloplasma contractile SSD-17B TaxID=1033810 RepID=U2FLM4_9MOLU|nr:thiol-disulfide isomerase [Haloplasma contractile]ERJ12084.1 hypothetical protein HLPCO_001998 [Haloplasma contractile SSD-17B]